MKVVKSRIEMMHLAEDLRMRKKRIGFVPTMGFLHEGHLSLVRKAREENEAVVVSIYVNPTQFAPHEDFDKYPRDFEKDALLLKGLADIIFYPDSGEIYGSDEKISFKIKDLTGSLCGISRPHHFPGVVQVVAKLLNIVKPHRIYLGQKDYQQTVAVRHLIEELFFDTEMVVCPTVRESDGLAMSSRNSYLGLVERKQGTVLSESLRKAKALLDKGEKNPDIILKKMEETVSGRNLAKIDYMDIRDAGTLKKVTQIGREPVVIAVAVFFGKTRLIDNMIYVPER